MSLKFLTDDDYQDYREVIIKNSWLQIWWTQLKHKFQLKSCNHIYRLKNVSRKDLNVLFESCVQVKLFSFFPNTLCLFFLL